MPQPLPETNDDHIRRLNTLIARAVGVATVLYHAPNINVDNASPRAVMSDIIDELVRIKRVYEAVPNIFEAPAAANPQDKITPTKTKGKAQ